MRDKWQHSLNGKVGQHLEYTKQSRMSGLVGLFLSRFFPSSPKPWTLPRNDSPLIACHTDIKLYLWFFCVFFNSAQILRVNGHSGALEWVEWKCSKNVLIGRQACPWACAVTCLPMQNLYIPFFVGHNTPKPPWRGKRGCVCHKTSAGLCLLGQSQCLFLCFWKKCRINVFSCIYFTDLKAAAASSNSCPSSTIEIFKCFSTWPPLVLGCSQTTNVILQIKVTAGAAEETINCTVHEVYLLSYHIRFPISLSVSCRQKSIFALLGNHGNDHFDSTC